jgi:cation transport ATPase
LPLLWRLPLSLAWLGAITLAFAANMATHGGPDVAIAIILAGLLAAQWLVVQLPLWGLAVFYGLRLRHRSEAISATARDRQFGIRQVMILTLIIAVVLGVGRMLVANLVDDLNEERISSPDTLIFVYLTLASILLTLPLLLATIIPRHAWAATLAVLVLIALGTWWQLPLMSRAGAAAGPNIWHIVAINGFSAGWIVLVMGLLRVCGYRANVALS